jgi:hypothetical protein
MVMNRPGDHHPDYIGTTLLVMTFENLNLVGPDNIGMELGIYESPLIFLYP